jgi:phage terminase large subunit-like protein
MDNVTTGFRRINTVYDKEPKKNGKPLKWRALYALSLILEMSTSVAGATKLKSKRALLETGMKMYIESPVANPALRKMGFRLQKNNRFKKYRINHDAVMADQTQDGINCHVGIIDEYHKAWQR